MAAASGDGEKKGIAEFIPFVQPEVTSRSSAQAKGKVADLSERADWIRSKGVPLVDDFLKGAMKLFIIEGSPDGTYMPALVSAQGMMLMSNKQRDHVTPMKAHDDHDKSIETGILHMMQYLNKNAATKKDTIETLKKMGFIMERKDAGKKLDACYKNMAYLPTEWLWKAYCNDPTNLIYLSPDVNLAKSNKDPREWIRDNEFLGPKFIARYGIDEGGAGPIIKTSVATGQKGIGQAIVEWCLNEQHKQFYIIHRDFQKNLAGPYKEMLHAATLEEDGPRRIAKLNVAALTGKALEGTFAGAGEILGRLSPTFQAAVAGMDEKQFAEFEERYEEDMRAASAEIAQKTREAIKAAAGEPTFKKQKAGKDGDPIDVVSHNAASYKAAGQEAVSHGAGSHDVGPGPHDPTLLFTGGAHAHLGHNDLASIAAVPHAADSVAAADESVVASRDTSKKRKGPSPAGSGGVQ